MRASDIIECSTFRLVPASWFWGTPHAVLAAVALAVLASPTALLGVLCPAFFVLVFVVAGAALLARRVAQFRSIIWFGVVSGLATTLLMLGHSLLWPQRWRQDLLSFRGWEPLLFGAIATMGYIVAAALIGCAVRLATRRPVERELVSCRECHRDLVGHDTGQCPQCGAEIWFSAAGLSGVEFHELAQELRDGTTARHAAAHRWRMRWLALAGVAAVVASAWLCAHLAPVEHTVHNTGLRLLPPSVTVVETPERSSTNEFDLGDGYRLTRHDYVTMRGWPRWWLRLHCQDWTAARGAEPISVRDPHVTGWIAGEQRKQEEYRAKNREKPWKTPELLTKWLYEEDFSGFPRARSAEIRWNRFFAYAFLPALVLLIPFAPRAGNNLLAKLRTWVRARSTRIGMCEACGYDLRGSRGAGRCPECGTPFARVV